MPLDPSDAVAAITAAVTGAVGWLTGRRRAAAEIAGVEATVGATQAAAWRELLEEHRALHSGLRESEAASQRREADCLARYDALAERTAEIEAALRLEQSERRAEVRAVLDRVRRVSPTPSQGHSTITAPVDPLAQTPRDGGTRLSPVPLPDADEAEPTPDLHASVTPLG